MSLTPVAHPILSSRFTLCDSFLSTPGLGSAFGFCGGQRPSSPVLLGEGAGHCCTRRLEATVNLSAEMMLAICTSNVCAYPLFRPLRTFYPLLRKCDTEFRTIGPASRFPLETPDSAVHPTRLPSKRSNHSLSPTCVPHASSAPYSIPIHTQHTVAVAPSWVRVVNLSE